MSNIIVFQKRKIFCNFIEQNEDCPAIRKNIRIFQYRCYKNHELDGSQVNAPKDLLMICTLGQTVENPKHDDTTPSGDSCITRSINNKSILNKMPGFSL
ncbi:MAG: hypothetical protein HUJ51_00015 [Eggerthellaceae bacterium]|nr:hypothetical protein [Eggerthellaceae bacterium]